MAREWTDVDYAQAAIDMLPGTVEEIWEFMDAQKVGNEWDGGLCPLDRWIGRWVEGPSPTSGRSYIYAGTPRIMIPTPPHLRDYISEVDA